jgi:hypothetical protein
VSGPHLLSEPAAAYLAAHRYTVVTWNSVPGDWQGSDAWVVRAIADIQRQDWTLLVLHDIEGAAVGYLGDFLDLVSGKVTFERDFPADCLPMEGGVARPGLEAVLTRRVA